MYYLYDVEGKRSAGLETNLAPSMTIGTGFFGRSSVAENLHPSHLVQWTRLAYNSDQGDPFGDFADLMPWQVPAGPVPAYPLSSNQRNAPPTTAERMPEAVTPARSGKKDTETVNLSTDRTGA
jgi:acetaldehyde dehydrogenase/alcohol dehydrogenase